MENVKTIYISNEISQFFSIFFSAYVLQMKKKFMFFKLNIAF